MTSGSAMVNDVSLRSIVIGMGKISRSIESASYKPASRSGRWVSTGQGDSFTESTVNRGLMRWRTAPGGAPYRRGALINVVEDLADDGGIRHIGNDSQASTAVRAERDIELEDPF